MDPQPDAHPTDQVLHSYGRGQLDGGAADSVSAHVEICPACRRRVAEICSDGTPGRPHDALGRPESPVAVGSSAASRSRANTRIRS